MRKRVRSIPVWSFDSLYPYELLVVIIIIMSLAAIAVREYSAYLRKARVAAAAVEKLSIFRTPISAQFALTGKWPRDNAAVLALAPEVFEIRGREDQMRQVIDRTIFVDGAIDVQVPGLSDGRSGAQDRILTLRPATPQGDPFGPVVFLAGPWRRTDVWSPVGGDRTTVLAQDVISVWK